MPGVNASWLISPWQRPFSFVVLRVKDGLKHLLLYSKQLCVYVTFFVFSSKLKTDWLFKLNLLGSDPALDCLQDKSDWIVDLQESECEQPNQAFCIFCSFIIHFSVQNMIFKLRAYPTLIMVQIISLESRRWRLRAILAPGTPSQVLYTCVLRGLLSAAVIITCTT